MIKAYFSYEVRQSRAGMESLISKDQGILKSCCSTIPVMQLPPVAQDGSKQ